jgi:2-C-methyl-D-erythritol 4-phosphate cytidylyltransferase/2-C-methyl-D-erythritol 2,4-cyclodiphosphate synthase
MQIAAIIAAGGRGLRLGVGRPKQLVEVGGRPILQHSVDTFLASDRFSQIVVVLPPELVSDPPACLQARGPRLQLIGGGARRQDSVANGFDRLAGGVEVIVVHDAARPFVDRDLIDRTLDAAIETGAAIAALRASDTVKQADPESAAGRPVIGRTLARDTIFLAQTPQAFRVEVLRDAIALGRAGREATDEAALAEEAGHRVRLVEGSARNIKITTCQDLAMARAMAGDAGGDVAARPAASALRVGAGYDLHRLVDGRPLMLGGVTIPHCRGLQGHSDADVLCHAITDAVLGAAGSGDIGRHFPDSDDRWRGASSLDLLRRAVAMAREAGFRVVNVDAVVVTEQPRLAPHVEAIVRSLAGALSADPSSVSVKGKTNEGVGEIGRGEAIAAHAVALLERVP